MYPLGHDTVLKNSIIKHSLVQESCKISAALFDNSMIGNHVQYKGAVRDVSIGDFTTDTVA